MANTSLAGQTLISAATKVHDAATAQEFGFPALAALSEAYTNLITLLLAVTTTPGELGMIAAVSFAGSVPVATLWCGR